MNEVPITQVTPLNNGAVRKGLSYCSGRQAFFIDVEFTLQDGRKIPGSIDRQCKKDLPGALARAQQSAAAGAFLASFNDEGEYWGTVQKWHIGLNGMQPSPEPVPTETVAA